MINFALEIWDNECPKCTFYTVRWIDAVVNETDKFFNKYYIFNGGVRSAGTNQESKELHIKWTEACRFAKVIDLALRNGEITINKNRILLYYNGDKEIYL